MNGVCLSAAPFFYGMIKPMLSNIYSLQRP